jgi:guanylate kinase
VSSERTHWNTGVPGEEWVRVTRAFPIVISGPSGAGKTTLINRLIGHDPRLKRSVSVTTRPPRDGETEGESYFFLSVGDFETLKAGKLIEWAEVHGHFYGTPRDFVEESLQSELDVVLNVDVQGGCEVKKCFPDAVMIFILPPSFEVLEQRITARATDLAGDIQTRLENARKEIQVLSEYEYLVVNDDLGQTVALLRAIIESERSRVDRYPKDFGEQFGQGISR